MFYVNAEFGRKAKRKSVAFAVPTTVAETQVDALALVKGHKLLNQKTSLKLSDITETEFMAHSARVRLLFGYEV